MSKQIKRISKMEIIGGKAKPGAALASFGINMPQFCSEFNERTKNLIDDIVPIKLIVYIDKTFSFELKTAPTAVCFKKIAKVDKGSPRANQQKIGTLTLAQIEEVATYKLPDLNTNNLEKAKSIVSKTALNMGFEIKES